MVCTAWATVNDLPECGDEIDENELEANLLIASEILNLLVGSGYPGVCEDTVRPVRRWDSISGASVVRLPGIPIIGVDTVLIDGQTVPSDNYRILNGEYLAWHGTFAGVQTVRAWPTTQRLDLDTTERGTWEISYSFGRLPGPGGIRAAARLGAAMTIACTGGDDAECARLSDRVTSVARQGVTYTLSDFMVDGGFGIAEVDWWLSAELLGRQRRPWTVVVPDAGIGYARTTTAP